jgi:MerR family copper efflux transcriptional regulator
VQVPIACSLTEKTAHAQLDEWRDLAASGEVTITRISPAELALQLSPDLTALDTTVRLAQREKACCPFFGFDLRIEATAVTLHVSVPEDAVAILDMLVG